MELKLIEKTVFSLHLQKQNPAREQLYERQQL